MRSTLAALLCAGLIFSLAACQPDQAPPAPGPTTPSVSAFGGRTGITPTPAPTATATPSPTPTPTEVPVAAPARRTWSVGLVAAADQEENLRVAGEALRLAARETGVEAAVVPAEPGDIARNAARLAEAGYEVVIVSGHNTPLGLWLAQRYPTTKFVVFGRVPDPPPTNLTGIDFAEDQAGFLAGTLAGWLTQRDMVAFVGGRPSEDVVKFRKGYEHGVRYVNAKAVVLGKYLDANNAPDKGAAEARAQLAEGADILFAAGGTTARGALEAAARQGVPVIAADPTVYISVPAVAPWLAGAAVVRTDRAIADVVRAARAGTLKGGTLAYDVKNGGVELGSYFDWAKRVPVEAQEELRQIFEGLRKGTVKTQVVIPDY